MAKIAVLRSEVAERVWPVRSGYLADDVITGDYLVFYGRQVRKWRQDDDSRDVPYAAKDMTAGTFVVMYSNGVVTADPERSN
jgi:hypothetical protein